MIAIPISRVDWLCFVVYRNRGGLSSRFYNSRCGEVFGSQWMFVIFCCFYDLFWVLPAVRAQVLLLSLPLLYRDSKVLPLCVAFFFVWNRYQRKIVKTWGEIKKGKCSLMASVRCAGWKGLGSRTFVYVDW